MKWGRVHGTLATNRKWLALSMADRGAWATLLAVAIGQEPPGVLHDRGLAELLLRRDGADDSPGMLDRLIKGGLLDAGDDGSITFHDWNDHNPIPPSETPEAWRERKARQRTSREVPSGQSVSHDTSRRDASGVPSMSRPVPTLEKREKREKREKTRAVARDAFNGKTSDDVPDEPMDVTTANRIIVDPEAGAEEKRQARRALGLLPMPPDGTVRPADPNMGGRS